VELHSPVVTTPFRGREAAAELYGVLFSAFGDVDLTDEFAADDVHAFFWRADVNGRRIEGADLLRSNQRGEISEITVLIRPLVDIAAFAAAVGPALARRRGRLRSVAVRLLTLPLRAILAAADVVASRLTQPR